ncbi:MAG: GBS Bsp-like repeat-containing protein, partial [Lachnospiraceae bacterium]|nr:GBS Bsp-like repeat-containing protein [Lachnospiraceae bacterium]
LPDETFEEDLLEGYILQQFYGSPEISLFSNFHCGDTLTGQTKAFYDALTPLISQVASGQISSTIFNFDSSVIMEKNQKSAAELGVSQVTEENVKELAASLVSYDSRLLINSLLADMPYELYWFNKMSGGMKISYTIGYTSTYVRIKQFKVSFTVVPDYQGADVNTVDSAKAASIGKAVSNAKAIIQQAVGLSDLEKIRFYKDKICDLTDYNYDAASGYPGGYGEPWQLVYVFDGDPSTNVVCEGYAKAFQYLMDETTFSSVEIYSILVTGTKSGGKHMWNILHMDDSRNYMVDVTAADSYRTADLSHRFLEIPDSGDVVSGYRYADKTLNNNLIRGADYKYDADTSSLYSADELTLTDIEYGKDPVPTLYANKKDGSEKIMTLLAKHVEKTGSGESIRVAIWSDQNGQDDLKWYEMQFSSTENAFKTDVPITNHRSTGLYYAHLYHKSATGKMTCLAKNTFEIHPVTAADLQVQIDSKDPSKAVATIYGVTCPSGVTEVVFPTWSRADQSDLVWYKGTKISEGVYQASIDAAKHKNESGTYQIHVYGTSGIGVQNFLLNSSCELKVKGPELQAVQNSVGYTLKISSLNTSDVKEVRYAIWSSKNGQDDLKWISTIATSGAASINWNPVEIGNHYIHVYVKTTSGQMIFQKGMELNVPVPSIESMTAAADNNNGNFRITVKGLKSPSAIRTVKIAVWNDAKQKDLIWYKAVKQADGSYTVDSNIAKHDYRTGTYHAHLYIEDTASGMKFAGAKDFDCVCSCNSLTAVLSADKTKAILSAKGLSLPFDVDHMSFAVWSEIGGQDDLRWYNAPLRSGNAEVTINVADHKSKGPYQVHLYAYTKTGKPIFVGKTGFTV